MALLPLAQDARTALSLANQEARAFHHEYIGTEHLLLGLVREASGTGALLLRRLAIEPHKVRAECEKLVNHGPALVTIGKLPQTPRAKQVIEDAIEEARLPHHPDVGTGHLLVGLLREPRGVAAAVRATLGVRLEEVRELLKMESAREKAPTSPTPFAALGMTLSWWIAKLKRRSF